MMVMVIAVKRRMKEKPRSRQSLPACLHQQTRLDGDTKERENSQDKKIPPTAATEKGQLHTHAHAHKHKQATTPSEAQNKVSKSLLWLVGLGDVWVMFAVAVDQWMYLLMMSSSLAYVASGMVLRVPMMAPFIALCSG